GVAGDRDGQVNPARSKVEDRTGRTGAVAQVFEGCSPEPAGGPLEAPGDGVPRWMVAARTERCGHRIRLTSRLVRTRPARPAGRGQEPRYECRSVVLLRGRPFGPARQGVARPGPDASVSRSADRGPGAGDRPGTHGRGRRRRRGGRRLGCAVTTRTRPAAGPAG